MNNINIFVAHIFLYSGCHKIYKNGSHGFSRKTCPALKKLQRYPQYIKHNISLLLRNKNKSLLAKLNGIKRY